MRLLVFVLLLTLAHDASAQAAPAGAIEGVITDSVHARPLAGAIVRATRVGADRDTTHQVTSDSRGRFRFDPIDTGQYALSFASAFLDSLEFGGPAPLAHVVAGETSRIALAIPSGATFRALACPGRALPPRTGALIGFVSNADTDRALGGAEVLVAWSVLTVDSATNQIVPDQRLARARVDAGGQYRLCGVPTGEWLVVQVQHAGRAGSVVRMSIIDAIGLLIHNPSFSAEGSHALTEDATPLSGTATLLGTVLAEGGAPVAGAQVTVLNTAPQVRTDALGQYVLTGLPAGTHVVDVKLIGYRIERRAVELRASRTSTLDVIMGRAVMLDSIAVVANRLRYPDFESHRRYTIKGTFIDPSEIERRAKYASYVSDMVRESPGYNVAGQGSTAVVYHGSCALLVVVNHDMSYRTVNDISPSDVGAIELYPDKQSAPSKLRSEIDRTPGACGAMVIWTKR